MVGLAQCCIFAHQTHSRSLVPFEPLVRGAKKAAAPEFTGTAAALLKD
jgi:hypothetical protein